MSAFDEAKAARTAARQGKEEALKHAQMKKFKREVRDVILSLVNEHGVEYRLQKDGQHIFLYTGKRGARPFKVAASRPVAAQMRYLAPWIKEHFPTIEIGEEKGVTAYGEHLFDPADDGKCRACGFEQDDGRAEHFEQEVFRCTACGREENACSKDPCAEVIADREAVMPEKEEEPVKAVEDQWEPYVYPTAGPSQFFVVWGDTLRCTAPGCEYVREGSFAGAHLHEYTHTEKHEEMLRSGVETRKQRAAEKVEKAFESIDFLARQYGFVLMTKEEAERFKVSAKTADDLSKARAEIERLQQKIDEQETRFALAKEAFGL